MATSSQLIQPQILLQVPNNSDLATLSSEWDNLGAFSVAKICKQLAQNSTSVTDGKTFNVATVECPFSSLIGYAEEGTRSTIGNQSIFGNNNDNSSNNSSGGDGATGAQLSSSIFKSFNPNAVMQCKQGCSSIKNRNICIF